MKVSVIGLGRLGAPMAACFASRGFEVWGVDSNAAMLARLQESPEQLVEPQLAQLLQENAERLHLGQDLEAAVAQSQATFLVVATPSDSAGDFSLDAVLPACRALGQALSQKSQWHLVVLTSTVMPLACAQQIVPALEAASGKKVGQDFGFCYSPEFIALGSVVRDLLQPDLVLIGEAEPDSGEQLESIYRRFCCNQPPFLRTNLVNAELAKLSLNTYITMKISFANSLARLCESTPGADCREVTRIVGRDSRVGSKYLQGGVAYGGPCFPRDTIAYSNFSRRQGVPAQLAEATGAVNQAQHLALRELVLKLLPAGGRLGILGLTYKAGSDITEQAAGWDLASHFNSRLEVCSFDPLVKSGCWAHASTAEELVSHSDMIVLATPWPEFQHLPAGLWTSKVVLDCWGQLEHLSQSCAYYRLGTPLNSL